MRYTFLAAVASLFVLFVSGTTPFSLIHSPAGLENLPVNGEAVTHSALNCTIDMPAAGYELGREVRAEFTLTLHNRTDRFVMVSADGRVYPPTGFPGPANYKKVLLFPHSEQTLHFYGSARYMDPGEYRCEANYDIGW